MTLARDGTPIQSVEHRSSGVILDLRPVALRDSVEAEMSQQESSFVATTTQVTASPTLIEPVSVWSDDRHVGLRNLFWWYRNDRRRRRRCYRACLAGCGALGASGDG